MSADVLLSECGRNRRPQERPSVAGRYDNRDLLRGVRVDPKSHAPVPDVIQRVGISTL
jgi:hypothetical protein